MTEVKRQMLLGKNCKLVQNNNFILVGDVVDIDEIGIMFKTTQKTSFIAWTNIRELTPTEAQ